MNLKLSDLILILHEEGCSCVIAAEGEIRLCTNRGIKDLYDFYEKDPGFLNDALIADRVIGKGAAALMVLGKVRGVYADVISESALKLLMDAEVPVTYGVCVPNIVNRTGTGPCPIEAICDKALSAGDCLPLIRQFIISMTSV